MITLQTITGLLIAAVLNVLGTDQREVAKVENEPVVKEVTTQVTGTFLFQGGTDWTSPSAYEYSESGTTCTDGTELCAIEAPILNPSAPPEDRLPVIDGSLQTELEDLQDADPQDREGSTQVMLKNN